MNNGEAQHNQILHYKPKLYKLRYRSTQYFVSSYTKTDYFNF